MTTSGDFFIVDNSDEHWKALEYLRQWCSISSGIDIATGHFEIGSLLALDGEWQKVGRIRVLLGGPSSRRTQEAVRLAASELDASLAAERRSDPFLTGLPAIVSRGGDQGGPTMDAMTLPEPAAALRNPPDLSAGGQGSLI